MGEVTWVEWLAYGLFVAGTAGSIWLAFSLRRSNREFQRLMDEQEKQDHDPGP